MVPTAVVFLISGAGVPMFWKWAAQTHTISPSALPDGPTWFVLASGEIGLADFPTSILPSTKDEGTEFTVSLLSLFHPWKHVCILLIMITLTLWCLCSTSGFISCFHICCLPLILIISLMFITLWGIQRKHYYHHFSDEKNMI